MIRLFTLIILFCLFACKSDISDADNTEKVIRVSPESNEFIFSNYFSDCRIVEFKNVILSDIRKIIPFNDTILVFAKSEEYNLHLFRLDGTLIRSFAKYGHGPNEYISLTDVAIFKNRIYAIDNVKMVLTEYTKDGVYKRDFNLSDHYESFAFIDEQTIALYNEAADHTDSYYLDIYHLESMNKLRSFMPIPEISNERVFTQRNYLYTFNDSVYLFKNFSHNTYKVTKEHISEDYYFDYCQNEVPEDVYFDKKYTLIDFVNYCRNSKHVWVMDDFMEDDKHVYLVFRYGKEIYFSLHSKQRNLTEIFNNLSDDVVTGIDTILTELFYPVALHNNHIYFLLQSYYTDYFKGQVGRLNNYSSIMDSVNSTNQILIIYKFSEKI